MFTNILFCTDFSQGSEKALKYAIRSALHNGATLHILHVLHDADVQFWRGYIDDEINEDAIKEQIKQLHPTPPELPTTIAVLQGTPQECILEYVRQNNIDLIVLGRQGEKHIFLGGVATSVVKNSPTPVLVVP